MLRIVMGRTGRLWPSVTALAESAEREKRPFYLIVPEQYTLKAERDLMDALGLPGLFYLAVLSPSRLQDMVFERAGRPERALLGPEGRRVAVAKALSVRKDDLSYYARAAEQPGFIGAMADLLSSLREEGVTREELRDAADKTEDPSFQSKLHDTALVLSDYEELLGDTLTDSENAHREMLRRLPLSHVLDGATVVFYGFDVLTPPLRDTMASCAALAEDTLVTLVGERAQAEDGHAFQPVLQSAQRLMRQMEETGQRYEFSFLPFKELNAPDDIRHLEKHFLGFERPAFLGPVKNVRFLAASTPYAEVEFVCQQVLRRLEKGDDPEEIYVLAGDIGRYGTLLSTRLAAYHVPCYVSGKTQVASHPVVRLLLSALRCLKDGWQPDDVEDMLSSGFTGLDEMECWLLRRYLNSYAIRGTMWSAPFRRGSEDERAQAEALRQKLVPPVLSLHAALKDASTASEAIEAVMAYLEELKVYDAASRLEEELLQKGMPEAAQWTRQVWGKLMETFEQIDLVLQKERIPLTRFSVWLEAALENIEVSALPPTAGCVQVGEIGRVSLGTAQAVFLIGLSDGFLSETEDALLSDDEMQTLETGISRHIRLLGPEKEKMRLLDLWKAMAAPKQALYLSYPLSDDTGAPQRPLSRLSAVRELLPGLLEEGGAFFTGRAEEPLAPGPALERAAELLKEGAMDGEWASAWQWLCAQEGWKEKADMVVSAARGETPAPPLAPEDAAQLFHLNTMSVTRLETFAACPYRHFVLYGLKPEEKKEWRVRRNDAGVFYHSALELFMRRAQKDDRWPDVTRERCDALLEEAVAPLTEEWKDLPFGDTERARALSASYLDTCRLAAWNLTEAFRFSAFRPKAFELSFGDGGGAKPIRLTLQDGTQINMRGKIDRVDVGVCENETYLRVVDYKSGNTAFSPSDVYAGQQLQLLIYLRAALDAMQGAKPAGLFYQKVDHPMLSEEEEITKEEAERKIAKALRLNGLALSNPTVYRSMDGREPPLSLDDRFFNQDGTPGKNKPAATAEEMKALMDFAFQKAADLAKEMKNGVLKASPLQDKYGFGPCTYCEYQGICRRDPLMSQPARYKENIDIRQLIERCLDEEK